MLSSLPPEIRTTTQATIVHNGLMDKTNPEAKDAVEEDNGDEAEAEDMAEDMAVAVLMLEEAENSKSTMEARTLSSAGTAAGKAIRRKTVGLRKRLKKIKRKGIQDGLSVL
jgi:hypothetical protein